MDSTNKLVMLCSIGAGHVFDYTKVVQRAAGYPSCAKRGTK